MIDHAARAIFVHIQKTGGTSTRAAFNWGVPDPHKHFRADQLKPIYGDQCWNEYFKFAFVRNPWDRLVSWWSQFEFLRSRLQSGAPVSQFAVYVLQRATTFDEFLRNASDEIADIDGEKWIFRNQIDYLGDRDGNVMVDFVGRFESLSEDISKVSQRVLGRSPEFPHLNASKRSDYRSYYTDELAELVARRYARDIQTFGYSFD